MDDRKLRMLAAILFILSLTAFKADCALFSYRNKYFHTGLPKKIQLGSEKQALQRVKRDTTGTPVGKVLTSDVVLQGTENHSQAFVHWSGKDKSEAVFILTLKVNASGVADSQTWRSLDYGKTYRPVNFTKDALITYFYVSPADHRKMVFTDVQNKKLYTSSNELVSSTAHTLPVASDDLIMHPTNSDWMLLYDRTQRQLYVTMDFGVSWTKLQDNVNPLHIFWGQAPFDDTNVVHLEIQPQDSEKAYYKRCTIPSCNAAGDKIDLDLGPFLPFTMLVANEYIFVQKTDWDGENSHVMVSHRRTEFKHAFFPANVRTKDFLMVNADGGQVFMAVSHGDNTGASLFLSDPTGRFYTMCLENIHHRATRTWFEVDLHEVRGLTGTYLVNQLDGPAKDGRKLKTLISVDKGGRWTPLRAPCPDQGQSGNCKLVLRLDLDNFIMDWILSETNAPGILIAHGHYGETYEHDLQNMAVFTSHDGARTWKKAPMTGLYHFNILDQGGIITAIQNGDQGQTKTVHYSYNDGESWSNEAFGDSALKVDGVLNEPGINTLVVSVYGHASVASPWTMVELNFSLVLSKKCDSSQYDDWIPADNDDTQREICILGQKVSYKRRTPGARCFMGEHFNRTTVVRSCNCTEEDFECDYGYKWDESSSKCTKESWYNDSFIAVDCTPDQTIQISQGYRKVAADNCTGGIESKYQPKSGTCPTAVPSQLILVSNVSVVATGDPVFFHLSQKLGSKQGTNYTWNFNDSHTESFIGPKDASGQVHSFSSPGLYNVTVTASNKKGSGVSDVLRLRVEDPVHTVGLFIPRAAKPGFAVTVNAVSNVMRPDAFGTLHYVWQFGDETGNQKGVLTWKPYTNHTYTRGGTYTLTVTVVNTVSALSRQMKIKVFDKAIVAQLTFSNNINRLFAHMPLSPVAHAWFLDSFTQELSMRTGVNMDRLSVTLNSTFPVKTDVLVTPPLDGSSKDDMSAQQIVDLLTNMIANKTLYLYQSVSSRLGDIQVTSIKVLDNGSGGGGGGGGGDDKKKEGPNYRAVYITVPIVLLAAVVTALVLLYYRRRFRSMRRYSLVNQHEDTDALLDDDDEPPLDLRSDSRDEPRSRDDAMLDLGTGSHLVMVTGSGGGDGAENC